MLQAQSGASDDGANRYRLSAFGATYDRGADAAAIDSGLRTAGSDLARRFDALAIADRQSQRATATQLMALEDDRHALYQAIVAQILRAAQRVAAGRHLGIMDFAGPRPPNSVDLTRAVKAELIR